MKLHVITVFAIAGAACFVSDSFAGEAQRITRTVPALEQLPPDVRTELAQNPDNLSADKLNEQLGAINAVELNNDISNATPGEELRVVAWNIERGRHWREAADLIKAHPDWKGVDILLISEMDLGMNRSSNEHTTRELARAMNMNYAYGVEFLELWEGGKRLDGTNADHEYGYHGNAILSRFPLNNVRMLRFPGIDRWWGSSQHRLGGRNAILAEMETANGPVTLISTHLESSIMDTDMRVEELEMIVQELEKYAADQPVILGGDLNAIPKSAPLKVLLDNGFDLESCNLLEEGTSQGKKRDGSIGRFMRIDYIAVHGLKAHAPAVLDAVVEENGEKKLISDHAGVAAIVDCP